MNYQGLHNEKWLQALQCLLTRAETSPSTHGQSAPRIGSLAAAYLLGRVRTSRACLCPEWAVLILHG